MTDFILRAFAIAEHMLTLQDYDSIEEFRDALEEAKEEWKEYIDFEDIELADQYGMQNFISLLTFPRFCLIVET